MSVRRICVAWAVSALLFLFTAALAVHSESAAQVVTLNYVENDSRYQTAQPCRALGGTVVTLNAQEVCSGIDKNDTFCIVGSDDAFPCRGLYKHVVQCNSEFSRPALNSFFCGESCSEQIHEFPRGASCVFDIPENAIVTMGVTVAANITVIAPANIAKILAADRRALNLNPLATMDLTFEGAEMGDMRMTVGQVLILPEFDEAGEAAFRVVTTIWQDGGNVVVRSRQAALAEVITDGEFVATIDLTSPPSAARRGAADGASPATGRGESAGCAPAGILNEEIDRSFPSGGALSGCGSFGAKARSTIRLRGGRLERLDFGGSASAELFANIAGNAKGEVSRDLIKKPGQVIFKFSIPVPYTPVKIPMYIYVNSDIKAVAKVSVDVGAKYRATAAFDVNYDRQNGLGATPSYNGSWTAVNTVVSTLGGSFEVSSDFLRFEVVPFLSPAFRKRSGDRFDLGLNVVPVAGKLSLTVKAVSESFRRCQGSPWSLTAGVRGYADLHLRLWDFVAEASPPLTFYDKERAIAEGDESLEGAPPPTGTETEQWLRENSVWGGKLDVSVRVSPVEQVGNRSHLQAAAHVSDFEAACWLIANDAGTEAKDDRGWTPLHEAAWHNASLVAAALIAAGAEVEVTSDDSRTPLHNAAWENSAAVASILIANGADVNVKNSYSWTPLHWAAWNNAPDAAKALINGGADVNVKGNNDWTPLHETAKRSTPEVTRILLEGGADADATDEGGQTPLYSAAFFNSTVVMSLLISHGADIHAKRPGHGGTPLHVAAEGDALQAAELLIASGARIDEPDNNGETPLHWAAQENAMAVAKVLIDNGAAVNAKDDDGETPLHYAARKNAAEVAKMLIAKGAEVNVENTPSCGYVPTSPLDDAVCENSDVAALIRSNSGRHGRCWRTADHVIIWHEESGDRVVINKGQDNEYTITRGDESCGVVYTPNEHGNHPCNRHCSLELQ